MKKERVERSILTILPLKIGLYLSLHSHSLLTLSSPDDSFPWTLDSKGVKVSSESERELILF